MPFAAIYICWGLFIGVWALGAFYNARYAPRTVSRDMWPGSRPWLGWIIVAGALLVQAFVPRRLWAAFSFRNEVLTDIGLGILVGSTPLGVGPRRHLGTMGRFRPALPAK